LIERIFRLFFGFTISIIIIRLFGPRDFGILSQAQSFLGIFLVASKLGLDNILIKAILNEPSQKEKLIFSTICTRLLISLILIVIIYLVSSRIYNNNESVFKVIMILSTSLFFQSFTSIDHYFQSFSKNKYVVIFNIISLIISSTLKLLLLTLNLDLYFFTWLLALETFITAALYVYGIIKFGELNISKIRYEFNIIKNLIKDSLPLMLAGISITIYSKIDQLMIGKMLGDKFVGEYSVAVRFSEMINFIPSMIIISVYPYLVSLKNSDPQFFLKRIKELIFYLSYISIAIIFVVNIIPDSFLRLIIGESYSYAIDLFKLYIVSSFFVFIGMGNGLILILEGKQKFTLYSCLITVIFNVILNLFMIPVWGLKGAVYSTLLTYLINSYLIYLIFKPTREIFRLNNSVIQSYFSNVNSQNKKII
jgi:O-antigen/teichoic acid export membrane protein